MPYSSEKQRRFMYSQHHEIAKRWDKEGKNYVKGEKHEKRESMSHEAKERIKERLKR